MQPSASRASARKIALRLALFYGASFAAIGISLPYWPVWLAAQGLSAGQIGVLLAANVLAAGGDQHRAALCRRPAGPAPPPDGAAGRHHAGHGGRVRPGRALLAVPRAERGQRGGLGRDPAARRGAGPAGAADRGHRLRAGAAVGLARLHARGGDWRLVDRAERRRRRPRPAAGAARAQLPSLPAGAGGAGPAPGRAAAARPAAGAAGLPALRPGGRADPGQPCSVLWLREPALARERPRRDHDRLAVGRRRAGRGCAVRGRGRGAAPAPPAAAADARGRPHGRALVPDGPEQRSRPADRGPGPARRELRRGPPRRDAPSARPRAGRAAGQRAGLLRRDRPRAAARPGHAGRGLAVCGERRAGVLGDGGAGYGRDRH